MFPSTIHGFPFWFVVTDSLFYGRPLWRTGMEDDSAFHTATTNCFYKKDNFVVSFL